MSDTTIPANRRILVIDDNRSIHDDFQKILAPSSVRGPALEAMKRALFDESPIRIAPPTFHLDSAFQGEEALALVERSIAEGRPYAMAFLDMRMPPGWDGIETAAKLWEIMPDLQIVICSAYSDYSWEEMLQRLGNSDRLLVVKKPFDTLEVLQMAHTLTEKWRLLQEARAKTGELEQRVNERTRELLIANESLQSEMLDRAWAEEALRQAQKMEAVGQLAGGIAHDFNNLLSVIRGYTGFLLADEHLDKKSQSFMREVDSAAERAAGLTHQLLTFSRKQVLQPEHLNLREVIGDVTKLLPSALGDNIALEIETAEDLPEVLADRAMVEQVLLNLAINARDAMPDGGKLSLCTTAVEFCADDRRTNSQRRAGVFGCCRVTDTGCGIAPENLGHIFEPFFTTKDVGKGTGLGLATAYGIVKQHDGWIEVESEPGQGTTFRIFLPKNAQATGQDAVPRETRDAIGGGETILLVEDEPSLRAMISMVLEHQGYRVHVAHSGADALRKWPEHRAEIDLLLTDMVMPDGISGRELAKRLLADKSDLKVIYSSGYSLDLVGRDSMLKEGVNFIPKPYTTGSLARVVRDCLDRDLVASGVSA